MNDLNPFVLIYQISPSFLHTMYIFKKIKKWTIGNSVATPLIYHIYIYVEIQVKAKLKLLHLLTIHEE